MRCLLIAKEQGQAVSGRMITCVQSRAKAATHHSCLQSDDPLIFDLQNETRFLVTLYKPLEKLKE